jgi:hypothetical protein
MRRIAVTLLCASMLACSVAGARAQSLYGPGGLFLHPTADIPPKGQLTLGAIVLTQRIPPTPGLHSTPTWGTVSLDYGLTPDIEIALTGLGITDFAPSYGGSFKYRFLHESRSMPAMALGATYSESNGAETDTKAVFLAARKQLTSGERHPITGHLGVQYIDKLAGLPYDQLLPHVGVEVGLDERWTLIGEMRPRGRSDFKTSTALSVAYKYGKGNRLVLTWVNTGQSTESRLGFGIGYTIGGE